MRIIGTVQYGKLSILLFPQFAFSQFLNPENRHILFRKSSTSRLTSRTPPSEPDQDIPRRRPRAWSRPGRRVGPPADPGTSPTRSTQCLASSTFNTQSHATGRVLMRQGRDFEISSVYRRILPTSLSRLLLAVFSNVVRPTLNLINPPGRNFSSFPNNDGCQSPALPPLPQLRSSPPIVAASSQGR